MKQVLIVIALLAARIAGAQQHATVVNDTAELFDTIVFSAGKVGYQVEIPPATLLELVNGKYADIVE